MFASSPAPTTTASLPSFLLTVLLLACIGCSQQVSLDEIRKLQARGSFEASVEPLRSLIAEDRSNPELNYLYGLALAQTGRRGHAEWALREAMEDPVWRLPAGRLLAYGEMIVGNHNAAIAALTELIEEHPDDVELLVMRANSYAHSRMHFEEALADTDRIFELAPDNIDAMEPLILALLGLERPEEAGEAIARLGEMIAAAEPDSDLPGWQCATAAIFAFESDELDLAAERWSDCTERFPDHSNVVTNALQFYDGRRDFPRSLEILERAVEAAPEARDFRTRLATRLRRAGRADEARELLLSATETEDPKLAATAWFDLAKHYQELADDDNAVAAFEESMTAVEKAGASLGQMQFEYADALVLAGNHERALEVAETIPVSAHREVIRARVAQDRGDARKALEHFEESFRLWPDNAWTRYYAALAAESIGDFDLAVDAYRYAIRINAAATNSRERLARLHLSEGKPHLALAMLKLKTGTDPLTLDGELLAVEILGAIGEPARIRGALQRLSTAGSRIHGMGLAAAARGMRGYSGPIAAIELIREAEGVDLTSPDFAEALRQLVIASSKASVAGPRKEVDAAVTADPESAIYREIEGLQAELAGDPAAARAGYDRALDLDPEQTRALLGLCRLSETDAPAQTIAACERVLAQSPGDPEASLVAARALRSDGRTEAAIRLLRSSLTAHPYQAPVATALAEALVEIPGADTSQVGEIGRRATRFSRSSFPEPAPRHG